MVKIPIGKKVVVNLWNTKKKRGMAKFFTDTMELIRAESEFDLIKGDNAIIVESYENFVVIVPEDEYTQILIGNNMELINIDGLNQLIYKLLKERIIETGGILYFNEIWSILHRTSIQSIITKDHIKKALKKHDSPFNLEKFNGELCAVLKIHEITNDIISILTLGKKFAFFSKNLLQSELLWSELRIERIIDYLLSKKKIIVEDSYRTGKRYFINITKQVIKKD